MKIKIQNILFPDSFSQDCAGLYFRPDRDDGFTVGMTWKNILFRENISFRFDTYFNSFSVEKWRKYTNLREICLCLYLSGKFKVTLLQKHKAADGEIRESVLSETMAESEGKKSFSFPFVSRGDAGILAFVLEAVDSGSCFYGGFYSADVAERDLRDVRIGIGICTYRREEFVLANIAKLRKLIDDDGSPLKNHLEVFISDNAGTLDVGQAGSPKIHIFPSRNLGGAGGFTRTIIEMTARVDSEKITHIILMDDDVVIEPESITRTFYVLSLLKEEYAGSFIGGAMLRLDNKSIQVESGALWNEGKIVSNKKNIDLALPDNVVLNETEEKCDYNAWWYCCFPMSIVRSDNLPLPVFIRGDDVEWGLRNMKSLILMNGICVWHEPFESKCSSFLEYYIIRNKLINNAIHCESYKAKEARHEVLRHCLGEIFLYRYKNAALCLQGVGDFLRGPEWLEAQDGEILHKSIVSKGYKMLALKERSISFDMTQYRSSIGQPVPKFRRIMRKLFLKGLFFPSKGSVIVSMKSPNIDYLWLKKYVMFYDEITGKAFEEKKSVPKTVFYVLGTVFTCIVLTFRMGVAGRRWKNQSANLRSLGFWRKYLGVV